MENREKYNKDLQEIINRCIDTVRQRRPKWSGNLDDIKIMSDITFKSGTKHRLTVIYNILHLAKQTPQASKMDRHLNGTLFAEEQEHDKMLRFLRDEIRREYKRYKQRKKLERIESDGRN